MQINLDSNDIAEILESLEYKKRAIRDAQGTPDVVRKENLDRTDRLMMKLRTGRDAATGEDS